MLISFIQASLVTLFLGTLPSSVLAVGTPFGLASGTTGGGSAAAATPTSNAQLASWLSDSTARVIVLDKIFDFTGTEGTTSGQICKPWSCSPNPQLAINANNWCGTNAISTGSWDTAGTSSLVVGSNKTLLGKGTNSGLKGKGLRLVNSNNVIIQNIRITDINAQYVWGGDAIGLEHVTKVWIDHNYIQHIGRQMLVSHYEANTQVTISNNVFNGDSVYSTGCNQRAYWIGLLTGNGDQITFAYNYLYMTSGRGPHVGGTSGYTQAIHLYNNYFVSIDGHAIDPGVGARVLAEGNYFNTVTTPLVDGDGQAYAPTTSSQASACSSSLGRSCVVNTLLSSGSLASGSDTGTLSAFTASTFKSASIMAASSVPNYVQNNAGTGKVN